MYFYLQLPLQAALLPPAAILQISPGKFIYFHPIYLPHLHPQFSDSKGLRLVLQSCPTVDAFYAVSVRQTGVLPPTSFRFHLTVDTLVLS
ncbi:hypothetical protein C7475_11913 [Chitinophaga sp. S165]|nr:hypothetical protein C7475_11913 [Chitinophaga sp. S165]